MISKNRILTFVVLMSLGFFMSVEATSASELTITTSDNGREIVLTDDELQALPQFTITTDTPWTETTVTYEGPTLWAVLEQAAAIGRNVEMIALNDYSVRLNADRITEEWPIVARLQNGKTMSVREKGPYWVMFPFDQSKDLQTETFYALSIWQLSKIEVVD